MPIVSPSPCASPPAVCTTRRVPWGLSCDGGKRDSGPPRPSRPRHTSWLVWSRVCSNTAARTSHRGWRPTQRSPANGRSRRWPRRPRRWGLPWGPSRRREKRAAQGRSGRARSPRAPPMPGAATCRKGSRAGLCPAHPTTATPTRQEGLSNGGTPFQEPPHPFSDPPHPPPERPNLTEKFLGRRSLDWDAV